MAIPRFIARSHLVEMLMGIFPAFCFSGVTSSRVMRIKRLIFVWNVCA